MKKEKIYVCGPTVYNHVHIGNIRPIMTFDILNRAKKYLNYEIDFLHNITDIDDKIINKAIEEGKTEKEISEFYLEKYLSLLEKFNIEKPNKIVKVTEKIDLIVNYIKRLFDKGFAYESDGNIFMDVTKVANYGSISNRKLDDMQNGEQNYKKKNAQDFALWKKTNIGIQYDSPFGKGRPGWHSECSAMIEDYFKETPIDIHGGGIDLIFPHHENENAQNFALNNKQLTKVWKHTGHINMNGEKMSKSLGNIFLAQDFLAKYEADNFRSILLTSSIYGPIDFSEELISSNSKNIEKFRKISNLSQLENENHEVDEAKIIEIMHLIVEEKFSSANREINLLAKDKRKYSTLRKIFKLLGFQFANFEISQEDKNLFDKWKKARENANYSEADEIREKLILKKII